MNPLIRSVVLIPFVFTVISGCTFTIGGEDATPEEVLPEKVKNEETKKEEATKELIRQQETEPEEIKDEEFDEEKNSRVLVATIDPSLDYSGEVPDCKTAAQRIADNVQIGMRLADVRRVVGRPKIVFPGSWWWSDGFSLGGRPNVRFSPGVSEAVEVSAVSIESSSCR